MSQSCCLEKYLKGRWMSSSVKVFASSEVSLLLRLCSWCLLSNAGVLCWIQEQWACCIFLFAWHKMPMHWHEPFTFSRITFLQSVSVCLFISDKSYFLFLSCAWNTNLQEKQFNLAVQFTTCVKFRFRYFVVEVAMWSQSCGSNLFVWLSLWTVHE